MDLRHKCGHFTFGSLSFLSPKTRFAGLKKIMLPVSDALLIAFKTHHIETYSRGLFFCDGFTELCGTDVDNLLLLSIIDCEIHQRCAFFND